MTEKKTSEAQRRASRKWDAKNKNIKNKSSKKSHAKGYITKMIDSVDEIEEVKEWIKIAEERIKN